MQSYKKLDFSRRSNEGADQCFSIHGFCETRIIKWCSKYLVFQGENWFFIYLSFHENIFCTLALFHNSALQCDTIPEIPNCFSPCSMLQIICPWPSGLYSAWPSGLYSACPNVLSEERERAPASIPSSQFVLGWGAPVFSRVFLHIKHSFDVYNHFTIRFFYVDSHLIEHKHKFVIILASIQSMHPAD